MTAGLSCADPRRRRAVRRAGLCGIDAVEVVGADHRAVELTLIGRAPRPITAGEVRIDGEPALAVGQVTYRPAVDEDGDDVVRITLDRAGGPLPYTVRLVEPDERGRPGEVPLAGVDPRFAHAVLDFLASCPTDLDCARPPDCPAPSPPEPSPSYLAKDYASFRRLLLDRLALLLPDWTERHVPDLGITLVELLAYVGDQLSYYQDAVATEAYLGTARRRISVRRHLRLVDHRLHDGCNARAWVCVEVDRDVPVAAGDLAFATGTGEVFEPVVDTARTLRAGVADIELWTWGDADCCLASGATAATLKGSPQLAAGDVLVLVEVAGARTGAEADADPAHRQAVRLASVTAGRDELLDQPVVEVTWAEADALTFPLCTAVARARGNAVLVDHGRREEEPRRLRVPDGPAPLMVATGRHAVTQRTPYPAPATVAAGQAALLETVPQRALARVRELAAQAAGGTVLGAAELAEVAVVFGRRALTEAGLTVPPGRRAQSAEEQAAALTRLVGRAPGLLAGKHGWLRRLARRCRSGLVLRAPELAAVAAAWGDAYVEGLDPASSELAGPATAALDQDPRAATPALHLADAHGLAWDAVPDLLGSDADDRHVVAEGDDDAQLWLRFGDGSLGRAPEPGSAFELTCRLGNGAVGNVGAGAIDRLAPHCTVAGIAGVHNPMPAAGGTDPEPVAVAVRVGPHALRARPARAVTAADYVRIAGTVPGVARAAGVLRWTGSWHQVDVAVDAAGTAEASEALLDRVAERLHRFRRIGHDLVVRRARSVALQVTLHVCAHPDHLRAHVKAALLDALGSGIRRDGSRGFFHPDRLSFGDTVTVAALVAAAAAVPGVESVDVTRLERRHQGDRGELAEGRLRLGPLEIARLDNDAARPEQGVLEIVVEGGR